jgi:hypothetical protein
VVYVEASRYIANPQSVHNAVGFFTSKHWPEVRIMIT